MNQTIKIFLRVSTLYLILFSGFIAQASIVRVETNQGNIDINLYDQNTPATVANFLEYVTNGDYTNTIVHRVVDDFIIQSGGYIYDGALPLNDVTSRNRITNEPVYSNVRGTIAMAKIGNDPNSATNQWFVNLTDNSANLDGQNGGFTVFGEVIGDGMNVVDQIAAIQTWNLSGAFSSIPLTNYTSGNDPDDSNFVLIYSVTVIDSDANTASGLNPPGNIYDIVEPPASDSSGGGGTTGTLLLVLLLFALGIRKSKV